MQLLVVDDPALAKAVERLRGEWQTQTGAEFYVRQVDSKTLVQSEALTADAAIVPSALLAPLAERNLLVPLPPNFKNSPEWGDVFELLKLREATWGEPIYAVPFGSPVFTLYYCPDLLDKIHRQPPQTWAEYQQTARFLAAEKPAEAQQWSGTLEPLAPGWAGLVLLARAAPYAKHRNHYSTLFHIDTMEPLIAGPPFLQALEELVAVAKPAAEEMLHLDPAGVRQAFWQGKCGMALTWPSAAANCSEKTAAFKKSAKKSPADRSLDVAELPGASRVYNLGDQDWVEREEEESPHVPLLAVAGRLGVVSAQSPHQEAAFRLLFWLSEEKTSAEICPHSPATTLFRNSHRKKPKFWGEKQIPATTLADYADLVAATLKRQQWLAFRLPGREEYLTALDEAVRSAVGGQATPADALKQVTQRWREITKKRGVDAQRKAYLHSLGLEE